MENVIFLFSLPRSGSTLLQRMLMTHPEIASVGESWLLLPFCYTLKKQGLLAEYRHATCHIAFEDFIKTLPDKEEDYYLALKTFAKTLYEKQCLNNEKYFLDKTPRYYFIIPEIVKIFPEAKFIFYETDLTYGHKAIVNGYKLLKHKFFIRYEELVLEPEKSIKSIYKYLEKNIYLK